MLQAVYCDGCQEQCLIKNVSCWLEVLLPIAELGALELALQHMYLI